jgi:H+-transporting ATPase
VNRLGGLSSGEAAGRLREYGPNAAPDVPVRRWRAFLGKFWAPVPWMLEATIALQLALGKADEGLVITVLLVLNAAISFAQEHRADRALALLKQRLSVSARVLRDGR